jgi:hypothetical protein
MNFVFDVGFGIGVQIWILYPRAATESAPIIYWGRSAIIAGRALAPTHEYSHGHF